MRRAALASALACSFACASSTDYVSGRPTLNRYSLEEEVELGTRMSTVLLASTEALGMRTDPDDDYTRAVRRVAARMLEVPENRAHMPPFPWEVHVVGAADANAWCFAGGQLVVSTGLLQSGMVRDDHELAALLGHELAHAAARHVTEKRTLAELAQRLGPLGNFLTSRLVELANPDSPRMMIQALEDGGESFDRQQELEADVIGLELMARAGFDPARAAEVWARIARAEGQGAGLSSTHPGHADRARELQEHLRAARYVAARRASRPPAPLAGWTWSSDQVGRPAAGRSLSEQGALPQGARVASAYLAAPAEVLRLEAHQHGRRATLRLAAARDLYEDRLPLEPALSLSSATSTITFHLARRPLTAGPSTEILVNLPLGAWRLDASATVGALRAAAQISRVRATGSALRYSSDPGAPEGSPPPHRRRSSPGDPGAAARAPSAAPPPPR